MPLIAWGPAPDCNHAEAFICDVLSACILRHSRTKTSTARWFAWRSRCGGGRWPSAVARGGHTSSTSL
eukprot:7542674-Alexandrium_andersonii.AAC.1